MARKKEGIDFKKLYHKYFLEFAKKALIPTKKAGELIKFKPNDIQLRHIKEWNLKNIILKPRQVGFSTLKLLEILFFASKVENMQIGIVFQDERSAREQAEAIQDRLLVMGPALGLSLDDTVKSVRRFRLKPTNATIYTGSGAGDSPLRGKTLQYLWGCLGKKSKIILASGQSVEIQNVNIGDEIVTSTGDVAKIKNKVCSGEKETFKVDTMYSNEPITMSKDHKVLTADGWKKCEELTIKDYIALPKITLSNKVQSYVFNCETGLRPQNGGAQVLGKADIPLDFDFGFYLGYYLSEGHCHSQYKRQQSGKTSYCSTIFAYHINETYYLKAMKFAEKYATSIKHVRHPLHQRGVTCCYGTFLASLTEEICGRTTDKHIPEWFFDTNTEFVSGVLAGYFSGDGSKTMKRDRQYLLPKTTATSICEKITRQIRRLALAMNIGVLGVAFRENIHRYNVKTKDVYIASASGDTAKFLLALMDIEYPDTKGRSKFLFKNGQYFVPITSIQNVGIDMTYDIEVDHSAHDFETTIGIVSNSEQSFWTRGDGALDSLLPAIDDECIVQLESTPNGMNNRFYDMYMSSKSAEKYGDFQFNACFYPWTLHREYQQNPPEHWEPIYEDAVYMDQYGLTFPQAFWRFNKLGGNQRTMAKKLEFARNYPISDDSCWNETMLDCPFSMNALQLMKTTNPVADDEDVRIYRYYHSSERYTIGVDTALGGNDDNAFVVLDSKQQVCACYSNNTMSPNEFGRFLYRWANKYHAFVVIEKNMYGHIVIEALTRAGYPSRQIYGFQTDKISRPDLFLKLDTWIINNRTIHDAFLQKTLMMFSKDKAKMKHVKDDIGIAFGIALWGTQTMSNSGIRIERI